MEEFSSFLDGEIPPAELEAYIDRLLADAEWQQRWNRVHLTRSLLAGEGGVALGQAASDGDQGAAMSGAND